MTREKRTYADRKDYMIKAVSKRRKRVKEMAVEHKGGRCEICGYSKCLAALELHHRDPSQKSFSLGDRGYTRSWEKIFLEIQKCVLLCANCHREVSVGIVQLPSEN